MNTKYNFITFMEKEKNNLDKKVKVLCTEFDKLKTKLEKAGYDFVNDPKIKALMKARNCK